MRNFGPILVSVLLHVGVFLLAFIVWESHPRLPQTSSVPVTIVAEVPAHEMAAAPVDELAVKTPEPVPAPPEPVKTPPPPTPTPQPVPEPTKAKPAPEAKKPAPPDKNGVKKPEPQKQKAPEKDILGDILNNTPSKSTTKRQAQANTRPTQGASTAGTSPADAGRQANQARAELGRRIMGLWSPNCDGGGDQIELKVRVWPSHGGRILRAPDWNNSSNDAISQAAFARARSAIAQVDISDLVFDDSDYTDGIPLLFKAKDFCKAHR